MTEIMSYVQIGREHESEQYLYACGYGYNNPYLPDSSGKFASMAKIRTEGTVEIDYLYTWGSRAEDNTQ